MREECGGGSMHEPNGRDPGAVFPRGNGGGMSLMSVHCCLSSLYSKRLAS